MPDRLQPGTGALPMGQRVDTGAAVDVEAWEERENPVKATTVRPELRTFIFCDYDLTVVVEPRPGETVDERRERAKRMLPPTRVRVR